MCLTLPGNFREPAACSTVFADDNRTQFDESFEIRPCICVGAVPHFRCFPSTSGEFVLPRSEAPVRGSLTTNLAPPMCPKKLVLPGCLFRGSF